MKAYRLAAWPQLRAPYDRIAYRRMLNDMSHRHVTIAQLSDLSGIRKYDVRQFVNLLQARGLVEDREVSHPDSLFGSLRPLGGWLKRALAAGSDGR